MSAHFNLERFRQAMVNRQRFRNFTVIAHVDHGKSTITDTFVVRAGFISSTRAGQCVTDTRQDEKDRGITIKSTAVTMVLKWADNDYIINLIDSPGHAEFASEVTSALRVSDGALLVVDAVDGVSVQTRNVIRQALGERNKLVLFINKLDRALWEQKLTGEEFYQQLHLIITTCNKLIEECIPDDDDDDDDDHPMAKIRIDPLVPNSVGFGSGKQGWGFTLKQLADKYAQMRGLSAEKVLSRMWGDQFYHKATNRWSKQPTGPDDQPGKRGFVLYFYEPLLQIFSTVLDGVGGDTALAELLTKLGVVLQPRELEENRGQSLLKLIMTRWSSAGEALLAMIVENLPSPLEAQPYRTPLLYTGPLDDETAGAIRRCDPNGPLVAYISKMVPSSRDNTVYAFGRVFSGTIQSGSVVNILSPHYAGPLPPPPPPSSLSEETDLSPSSLEEATAAAAAAAAVGSGQAKRKDDYIAGVTVQSVSLMTTQLVSIGTASAGSLVLLSGLSDHIMKSATIATSPTTHRIRGMKFSVTPATRVAVTLKRSQDLNRFMVALRKLKTLDPMLEYYTQKDTGQIILVGVGKLHLETAISDLGQYSKGAEFTVTDPYVVYRETVTEERPAVCLAKSANKLNRISVQARVMDEQLRTLVAMRPGAERTKAVEQHLSRKHELKLWAFGSSSTESNVLASSVTGTANVNEVRGAIVSAFQGFTAQGIVAGEELTDVLLVITELHIHDDAAHRSDSQIMPAARRGMGAAVLAGRPRLMESYDEIILQCPQPTVPSGVYQALAQCSGRINEDKPFEKDGCMYNFYGLIPTSYTSGFAAVLAEATSGQVMLYNAYLDRWAIVPEDPLQPDTSSNGIALKIRARKRLPAKIPTLAELNDKL